MLEAYLVTAGSVFLAEFGDKSQLLALVLAARFRRPGAVIAGMAAGLLLNHMLAAAIGAAVAAMLPAPMLRLLVGGGFLLAAVWIAWPEKADADGAPEPAIGARWGPFVATAITFFLVEMGDKTQLMTVALAARFDAPVPVMLGATTGVLLAAVPAVLFADRLLHRVPMRMVRWAAALAFAGLGMATLLA